MPTSAPAPSACSPALSTGWPASSWRRPHAAACCSTSGGSATAPSNTTVTGRRTVMLKTIETEQMSPTYLTQVELAVRWRISPKTLERWRWAGDGPRFLKIGGLVRYRLEDIEGFEAEQLRQITGTQQRRHSTVRRLRRSGRGGEHPPRHGLPQHDGHGLSPRRSERTAAPGQGG